MNIYCCSCFGTKYITFLRLNGSDKKNWIDDAPQFSNLSEKSLMFVHHKFYLSNSRENGSLTITHSEYGGRVYKRSSTWYK